MAALTGSKPVKFINVKPGSTIRVTHLKGEWDPFEATVLEMRPEYGPHRIPALVLKGEHRPDPIVVTANGETKVEVLLDSSVLASTEVDGRALRVRSIPVEALAVQFTGGSESATECIRFAASRGSVRWDVGDDRAGEALVLGTLEQEDRVEPGSWLVRSEDRIWHESAEDFVTKYELGV